MERAFYNHPAHKANTRVRLERRVRPAWQKEYDKNRHKYYIGVKILWSILISAFLILSVYQCTKRIRYYISDPSAIKTYSIRSKTTTYPSATICPRLTMMPPPALHYVLLVQALKEKGVNVKQTLDSVFNTLGLFGYWNASAFHYTSINYTAVNMQDSDNITSSTEDAIIPTYTILGKCLTVREEKHKPFGLQAFTLFTINGLNNVLNAYAVQIHPHEDQGLIKYTMYYNSLQFKQDTNWEVHLRATQMIYRNTRYHPCEENPAASVKCLIQCIEKGMYSLVEVPCRLPFMSEDGNIPFCSTYNKTRSMINALLKFMETYHSDNCNCLKKCKQTIYSVEMTSSTQGKLNVFYYFVMMFGELTITVIEEIPTYDFVALLADIGGSIGLFLGIGFLQFIELTISVFAKMHGIYQNSLI